jgi:hypothetical protein
MTTALGADESTPPSPDDAAPIAEPAAAASPNAVLAADGVSGPVAALPGSVPGAEAAMEGAYGYVYVG